MTDNDEVVYDGGRWYVYGLVDPIALRRNGSQLRSVFYVGKGTKDRALQHVKDERAALRKQVDNLPMHGGKAERIRYLLGAGEEIPAIMLATGLVDEQDAYRTETLAMELVGRLLAAYGEDPLTNAIPGHGQNAGLAMRGGPAVPLNRDGRASGEGPVHHEPQYAEHPSVRAALSAATSRRTAWTDVVTRRTILVKGSADSIEGATHLPMTTGLPSELQDVSHRVKIYGNGGVPGGTFVRRGWDPDDPWSDREARERATRYWPIAAEKVRSWLLDSDEMPRDLLLAIPGEGGTTVRYAWRISADAQWEIYPEFRDRRWGVPLAAIDLDHPALGTCLIEDRKERRGVQVLQGYASGVRVLEPEVS